MADEVWYVGIGGERKGPFTEEQVKEMIARGELTGGDNVWKDGMEEWQAAEQVEPFAEAIRSAPPPPPARRPAAGANPFTLFFKGFWTEFRGIIQDPDAGLATAADNKNLWFNITWLVFGLIVFGLLCLQRVLPGFMLGPTGISMTAQGPVVTGRVAMFFLGILHAVFLYGIWFGVLMAALKALKSQANWEDVLTLLALSTIPSASIGLVAFALLWITPFFAVFLLLAIATNIVFYFRLFCHVGRTTTRAAIYAVPVTYFASFVAYSLLRLLMT